MTDLWFAGCANPYSYGGSFSPDPVTQANTTWTWDVEFESSSSQTTYARASLSQFVIVNGGSAYAFSGIVSYRTRGSDGIDTTHHVGKGKSTPDGVADYMWDTSVDDVTFGWGIEGDWTCIASINMEIWVSS